MPDKDIDRDIKDIIENQVKTELETERGSVFSRKEVMNSIKERLKWKGTGDSEGLRKLYESGDMSRRKFLKMLGLGTGGLVVSSTGIGYAMGTKVFDLNGDNKGLITGMQTGTTDPYPNAPGSNIIRTSSLDEALNAFQEDDNKVILAAGEYDYGGGISSGANNTSLIGDGEVTWNLSGTNDGSLEPSSGDLMLKNITISGESSGGKSGIDLVADGDNATVIVDNLNMPDGGSEDEDRAFYTPEYAPPGQVIVRHSYWASFPSDGAYMDKAHSLFECCMGEDNDVNQFRIGQDGSTIRNCVGLVNDTSLSKPRGIHVREGGQNMLIENVHLTHQNGPPIELDNSIGDPGQAQGTIRDVRILNEGDSSAISEGGDMHDWDVENLCIKGEGGYPSESINGSITSSCADPVTDVSELCDGSGSTTSGSTTSGSTSGGTTWTTDATTGITSGATTHTITITGGSSSNPANYIFEASQGIERINAPDPSTGVFSTQATGTLRGGTHSYRYGGQLTDFRAEEVTVQIDGSSISGAELTSRVCNQ